MKHADNKLRTLLIRWSSFSLSPSSWLISSASILRIWGFLPSTNLSFGCFSCQLIFHCHPRCFYPFLYPCICVLCSVVFLPWASLGIF
jgi:hypothetical protein